MRLIDADELRKAFKKSLFFTDVHLHYAREIIDNAPTVEERPTGKWLEDGGNIACSNCHTIWLYRKTNYCPNCGADMREDEE